MENIEEVVSTAWIKYHRWQKQPIFCSAFGVNVHFSRQGWEHIVGAEGARRRRSISDIKRRIRLLGQVRDIIAISTEIHEMRVRAGHTYYALQKRVNDENGRLKLVRVIVTDDKKGKKIFYSVMDRQ